MLLIAGWRARGQGSSGWDGYLVAGGYSTGRRETSGGGSGDGREEGERRAGENFPSGLQKKDDVMPEVGELVGRGYERRCGCVYITRGTQLRQGSFLS